MLCVVGIVVLPLAAKFSAFKLELLNDDSVIQRIELPPEVVADIQKEDQSIPVPIQGRQVRLAMKLAGVQIKEPCVFRVRVLLDEIEVWGNGLEFSR